MKQRAFRKISTEKRCIACGQTKPASFFFRHAYVTKTGRHGVRFESACKACKHDARRQWRTANHDLHRQRDTAYKRKNAARNAVRRAAQRQADLAGFRQRARAAYLKSKYGLSVEQFNAMLQRQDGRCAICREKALYVGTKQGLHVDHDHVSGSVRGLLCHHCNVAIGYLREDVNRAEAAVRYLKRTAFREESAESELSRYELFSQVVDNPDGSIQ